MAALKRWAIYVLAFVFTFLAGYGFASAVWGPRW